MIQTKLSFLKLGLLYGNIHCKWENVFIQSKNQELFKNTFLSQALKNDPAEG